MSAEIVWNKKIRLLHWLMAVAIITNLFVFDDGEDIHNRIGYTTLAIVVIRVWIGFTASGYEAFKNFNLHPQSVLIFLKQTLKLKPTDYKGHNSLASYSYLFFWGCVVGLGITGILLVHVDAFFGDELLEEIHEILSVAVQVFLATHLLGIVLDSYLHKRKAWMSMLTGRKD